MWHSCGEALARCDVAVAAKLQVWCAGECGVAAERSLGGGRNAVEQVAGCVADAAEDWAASVVCEPVSLQGMQPHVKVL